MSMIVPVILCGGAGTRLWPLSREAYPKPLLKLLGEHSLLQETLLRLQGLDGLAAPLLVTNEAHRFMVAEQVQALGIQGVEILLEPQGRNTAPALAAAAEYLRRRSPEAIMVVMPADHVLPDRQGFLDAVTRAVVAAAAGALVTFGIQPAYAETGYGYIRAGRALADAPGVLEVEAFVEKPDAATADAYLRQGGYYWNSGIFVMSVTTWTAELQAHAPAIQTAVQAALAGAREDLDFVRLGREAFLSSPSDSIDYAVMEHTARAAMIPLDIAWSDVGAWPAVWELSPKDERGNAVSGDVLLQDVDDSLILAQGRCVAALGLRDAIVVETPDVVLVADRDHAQEVKQLVAGLKAAGRPEFRFHRRVHRPWGDFEGIDTGARYQVKRLTVNPGSSLSLQLHHHRAEHWVVVSGTARVTRGEEVFLLSENQSTYIPLGVRHRLENPGSIPLEIIEIQSGSYLGEDDIVRFEDVYQRLEGEGC